MRGRCELTTDSKRSKEQMLNKLMRINLAIGKDPRFADLLNDEMFIQNLKEAQKYLNLMIKDNTLMGRDLRHVITLYHAHVHEWLDAIQTHCDYNQILEINFRTTTLGELIEALEPTTK